MVRVEPLIFEYPGLRALDDVSFKVAPGRIVEHRGVSAGHQDEARVRIALASPVSGLRERIEALDSIRVIEADEDAAVAVFRGDQKARHELLRRLLADGLPVCAFAQEQVNLQDTYLATVRAADRGVAP